MMTERDLGDAVLARIAVERASSQARTQPAHGAAFRDHALDDPVRVLFDDVIRDAERLQVLGQDMLGKARLFLIEVHGDQFEFDRCTALQRQQDVEQRV